LRSVLIIQLGLMQLKFKVRMVLSILTALKKELCTILESGTEW